MKPGKTKRAKTRQLFLERLEARLPLTLNFSAFGDFTLNELLDDSQATLHAAFESKVAQVTAHYRKPGATAPAGFSEEEFVASEAASETALLSSLSRVKEADELCRSGYCQSVSPAEVAAAESDGQGTLPANELVARSGAEDLAIDVSFRLDGRSEGFSVFFTDQAGQSLSDGTTGTLGTSADFTLTFPGIATDGYARLGLGVSVGDVPLGYFLHVPPSLPLVPDGLNHLQLRYISSDERLEVSVNDAFITDFEGVNLAKIAPAGTENIVIGVAPTTSTTFIGDGSFGRSEDSPVAAWSVNGALGDSGESSAASQSATADAASPSFLPWDAREASPLGADGRVSPTTVEVGDLLNVEAGGSSANDQPTRDSTVPSDLRQPVGQGRRISLGTIRSAATAPRVAAETAGQSGEETDSWTIDDRQQRPASEADDWLESLVGRISIAVDSLDLPMTAGVAGAMLGSSPTFFKMAQETANHLRPQELRRSDMIEVAPLRRRKKRAIDACFAEIGDFLEEGDVQIDWSEFFADENGFLDNANDTLTPFERLLKFIQENWS